MMRQIRKNSLTMRPVLAIVFALVLIGTAPGPAFAVASAQRTMITDPLTGVAMAGFDPVSYFVEAEPVPGLPDFSLEWNDYTWYFSNAANRDVFAGAPDDYVPEFGGHCAMGLARGYLSDGNPRIYSILANRLFLFYSTGNRDAFLLAPRSAYERGTAKWQSVLPSLSK